MVLMREVAQKMIDTRRRDVTRNYWCLGKREVVTQKRVTNLKGQEKMKLTGDALPWGMIGTQERGGPKDD